MTICFPVRIIIQNTDRSWILARNKLATAMFCAFFSLGFGSLHLLSPPRDPPFPHPSTDAVLWVRLTPHGKSCFNRGSQSAPHVHEASPGTHTFFPSYTRHVYCKRFRAAIGLWLVRQPYPRLQPYMISVRRARVLPCFSFLPPQSSFLQIPPRDGHPCLRLTLPTAGRVRDFHPIERALAGRTEKSLDTLIFKAFRLFLGEAGYGSRIASDGLHNFSKTAVTPEKREGRCCHSVTSRVLQRVFVIITNKYLPNSGNHSLGSHPKLTTSKLSFAADTILCHLFLVNEFPEMIQILPVTSTLDTGRSRRFLLGS